MKRFLAILISVATVTTYSKCNKDALKGNNLYRVVKVDRKGGAVKFKRYRDEKTVVFECLPDSIVEGKLMMLPAFE